MHSNKLKVLAAAVVLAFPFAANAESNVTTGAAPASISATARVNFSILIPRFIFLQVGTGTFLAANAAINTITMNPALAAVGNGIAVAGTGGDLPGGAVTVRIIGNAGAVTLGASAPVAGLNDGGTNNIPWTQISATVTGGATHPVINGATAAFPATGGVVNVNGSWAYSYLNTTTPAAGTYTGQVLYTATTP